MRRTFQASTLLLLSGVLLALTSTRAFAVESGGVGGTSGDGESGLLLQIVRRIYDSDYSHLAAMVAGGWILVAQWRAARVQTATARQQAELTRLQMAREQQIARLASRLAASNEHDARRALLALLSYGEDAHPWLKRSLPLANRELLEHAVSLELLGAYLANHLPMTRGSERPSPSPPHPGTQQPDRRDTVATAHDLETER